MEGQVRRWLINTFDEFWWPLNYCIIRFAMMIRCLLLCQFALYLFFKILWYSWTFFWWTFNMAFGTFDPTYWQCDIHCHVIHLMIHNYLPDISNILFIAYFFIILTLLYIFIIYLLWLIVIIRFLFRLLFLLLSNLLIIELGDAFHLLTLQTWFKL